MKAPRDKPRWGQSGPDPGATWTRCGVVLHLTLAARDAQAQKDVK